MKHLILALLLVLVMPVANSQENVKLTQMPEWVLKTQDGMEVNSKNFQGKPLILHFWATWCPYCKKLQPTLDRLQKEYGDQGLQVLAVSIREDEGAKPQDVLDERGFTLKTVVEGDELAADVFSVAGTPTTFFIGPDGKVLGSTMQSDPNDPQWETVAKYLVGLTDK